MSPTISLQQTRSIDLPVSIIVTAPIVVVKGADFVTGILQGVFYLFSGEGGIFFEQEGDPAPASGAVENIIIITWNLN